VVFTVVPGFEIFHRFQSVAGSSQSNPQNVVFGTCSWIPFSHYRLSRLTTGKRIFKATMVASDLLESVPHLEAVRLPDVREKPAAIDIGDMGTA
jgi:hypothetical protein